MENAMNVKDNYNFKPNSQTLHIVSCKCGKSVTNYFILTKHIKESFDETCTNCGTKINKPLLSDNYWMSTQGLEIKRPKTFTRLYDDNLYMIGCDIATDDSNSSIVIIKNKKIIKSINNPKQWMIKLILFYYKWFHNGIVIKETNDYGYRK